MSTRKRTLILALMVLLLSGMLMEIGARVAVRIKYDSEQIRAMTTAEYQRGLYAAHPVLPYVLRPSTSEHNSLGWKGPEFSVPKAPGVFRIVCIGASTTYGGATDHARILEEKLREAGHRVEVLNAGVPGWTSRESLANFELRVLPTQPDLVVVYHGRNDLFPEVYDNFDIDYSHFRDWSYDFTAANTELKHWFGISRAFMLFALAFPSLTGWDEVAEHPIYGSIRLENRPPPERAVRNSNEVVRTEGFRRNIEQLLDMASSQGADVVLATFAFRPEKLY